MQRFVSALAFVFGFTGVIALASGWSTPAASQTDGRIVDAPGAQWMLPGNPSHTSFGTIGADGNYRGVVSPDEDLTPEAISPAGNTSHTSFGMLMPDGTYCGVGCPSWDSYLVHTDKEGNK